VACAGFCLLVKGFRREWERPFLSGKEGAIKIFENGVGENFLKKARPFDSSRQVPARLLQPCNGAKGTGFSVLKYRNPKGLYLFGKTVL
jgi:hypothetical protein